MRRVGESAPRRVDVRVLAATHRDLEEMVGRGAFRADLFYRLRVGRVRLPPLRERGGDVLLLAEAFLAELGAPRLRLSRQARASLRSHAWPGNVRELKNVIEVAAALAQDGLIRPRHLELPPSAAPLAAGYHERLRGFRRRLVEEALEACGGSRAAAARRLGLSRQALSYLVRRLEIR